MEVYVHHLRSQLYRSTQVVLYSYLIIVFRNVHLVCLLNFITNAVIGAYCPLGRSVKSNNTNSLNCPQDTYCPTAFHTTGIFCSCDKLTGCSYCPEGSTQELPCPAGFRCGPPHFKEACSDLTYCPANTSILDVKLCPAGYYCPNTSVSIICPSGYYCRPGSQEPAKCTPLAYCPEGSQNSVRNFAGIGIIFFCAFFIVVVYKIYQVIIIWYYQRKDKKKVAITLTKEELSDMGLSSRPDSSFFMDISFRNLTLMLKESGKVILNSLNGELKHGTLTAVMGLSGSGKSTFMTTLVGRANYGVTSGEILINGKLDSLTNYDRMVGFVPQEDIMLREMTVRQILTFSAYTRLGYGTPSKVVEQIVDDVIDILGLRRIQHQIIGDEKKRGISGGQRKRVNIGMELVAQPKVLFLDEPTSGLDSTASQQVCQAMRDIAERGITVITVIHQPRYEIFTLFHNVMLIGYGGNLVYMGPSSDTLQYFSELGFQLPDKVNPPDFFMDIMSGSADCMNDPEFRDHPEVLFDNWKEYEKRALPPIQQLASYETELALQQEMKKRRTHYPRQYYYTFTRCLNQLWSK
jgi:ABC-type multidrug transport system ATPase subunit